MLLPAPVGPTTLVIGELERSKDNQAAHKTTLSPGKISILDILTQGYEYRRDE